MADMTDIVERLRDLADANKPYGIGSLWDGLSEAADEIERLRAALREALPCLVRQYEDEAADIVRAALEAKP
jgi:hypothetical protein